MKTKKIPGFLQHKLRGAVTDPSFIQLPAKFGIGVNDSWDTLRRIETCNLYNVLAYEKSASDTFWDRFSALTLRPVELRHALQVTLSIIHMAIVFCIPCIHMFIQAIQTLSRVSPN